MESDSELRDTLRAAERAAAAPWTDYPTSPRWYYPAGGLWFTVWAWILTADTRWSIVVLVGLVAVLGAYVAWHRRRSGVEPRFSGAPTEIRRAMADFVVVTVLVAGLSTGVWLLVGPAAGFVTVFASTTAGLWWYEHRYAAAARGARERLA